MSELIRSLIVAGLMSGTQPITIMGLLLVMAGGKRRNSWAFLFGAFLVETAILITASVFLGGTVAPSSDPGRVMLLIRLVLGIALVIAGFRLRREPKKPAPEVPKALERLQNLNPLKSFIAGVLLADYVGPVMASLALAATTATLGQRLLAMLFYTAFATGIPLGFLLLSLRSQRAHARITGSTDWVLQHRRQIASWLGLLLGVLLIADATIALIVL